MKLLILSSKLLVLLTLVLALGCASRAYTPPRSEVIEKAKSEGIELPSIEEERVNFYSFDESNKERLLSVIRSRMRAGGSDSDYRIGVGDTVDISVFDVPELNISARVQETGMLALPLIGGVVAAGKTEPQLMEEMRRRLSAFVRNPQVSLAVAQYASQKVAVMGAVDKPGAYPLRKGANTVVDLLSEAGGVNERAGNYVNFIPAEYSGMSNGMDAAARARYALESDGKRHPGIEVYLDQIMGTAGGIPIEIPIRAGDMIVIPDAGKVLVEGEVQKPGSYELGPQLTMLGSLAAAGGITYGAKVGEVEVIREVSLEQKARLIVDLQKIAAGEERDVRLRNGDIVRVPSDSGRRMRQDTFDAIARIVNFGVGGQVNVAN